jgi:hypothetical protein
MTFGEGERAKGHKSPFAHETPQPLLPSRKKKSHAIFLSVMNSCITKTEARGPPEMLTMQPPLPQRNLLLYTFRWMSIPSQTVCHTLSKPPYWRDVLRIQQRSQEYRYWFLPYVQSRIQWLYEATIYVTTSRWSKNVFCTVYQQLLRYVSNKAQAHSTTLSKTTLPITFEKKQRSVTMQVTYLSYSSETTQHAHFSTGKQHTPSIGCIFITC